MCRLSMAWAFSFVVFVAGAPCSAREQRPQGSSVDLLNEARANAGDLTFWSEYVRRYPWLREPVESFESYEEFRKARPELCFIPEGMIVAEPDDLFDFRPVTWPPDYAEAFVLYEQVLLKSPEALMPPRELASFCDNEPLYPGHAQAHVFYLRYFERYPDLVCDVARVEAAICEKKLGRMEAAEKRLASLADKYEGVHYEPQDAIARTKISTDFTFIRPEEFARYELALMRAEQERFEEAEAGFEEVIRRYPNCRLAYLAFEELASILEKHGRLEDAADVLEKKWAHIEEHWPVYMGGVCSLSNEEKQKIRSSLMRRVRELRRRAGEREKTGR